MIQGVMIYLFCGCYVAAVILRRDWDNRHRTELLYRWFLAAICLSWPIFMLWTVFHPSSGERRPE